MVSSDCIVEFPKGQSKYTGGSARDLLDYLEEHNDLNFCYDMNGQPLTGSDREDMIEYADTHDFKRMGVMSLRWGNDLTDKEYRRSAREFFSEFAEDRPSLRVAWSVHRDTEHHHIQFGMFGNKEDCWTTEKQWERMCERGRDLFSYDHVRDLGVERTRPEHSLEDMENFYDKMLKEQEEAYRRVVEYEFMM